MPSKPHSSRRIVVSSSSRGMARHAVDVAVGGHHAGRCRRPARPPRTGTAARRAAPAGRCARAPGSGRPRPARGRPCACRWRRRRSRDRSPCRAADVGAAQLGGQVRVLAVGLLDPAPAGSRAMSRTGARACRAPVGSIRRRIVAATSADRGRVEGRGRADRLLEARRRPRPSGRAGTPRGRSPGCPAAVSSTR